MARTAALALLALALTVGEAQATDFRVVPVPGATLDVLADWQEQGAVGLLVPSAGPETSEMLARGSLVRGAAGNSLRGGVPEARPLITLEDAAAPPVVYVGIPAGAAQPNDRRYPILVSGRGFRGLLVSDSTRIPGLVSIADVAPTATGREGALSWTAEGEPAETLLALDRRIDANNDGRLLATVVFAGLVALLALVRPRAALLAFAAGLAANLALGLGGVETPWIVLATISLAVAGGGLLLARRLRSATGIGLAFATVMAAYLVVLGLDGPAVALSPLGPTQNSRFFGLSNLLETLLLVPALVGAALLRVRFGWPGFAAVAGLALVTVAGNRFGADGGGAIVLAAGFAFLALLLAHARKTATVVAIAGAAVVTAGLLAFDIATGASSHVTRAVEDGPGELAGDLVDRVAISYERVAAHWYVAVLVLGGIAALTVLAVRSARSAEPLARRAVPLALAAALATSLVVNDSPTDVVLVGLAAYAAVHRGMLGDPCAASLSPSRSRLSWPPAAAAGRSRPFPRP
jgi:hypothetical protein